MATNPAGSKKPARKKTAPRKSASKLAQAAATSEVKLYRQRRNGTYRRLPYLAPGTPQRKQAEQIAARRAKGEALPAIADDLKLSKSTVRRLEVGLALAKEIEAGQHDAAWDGKPDTHLVLESLKESK